MVEADGHHIARCLDGHPDDFRHLVTRYQRPLLAHLSWRLRQQVQVEDAAQETFVRAYSELATLRKPDSFFPWLLGIANNVTRELIRQERTERLRAEEQAAVQRAEPERRGDAPPGGDLVEAVAGLSDPLREVVLLRFFGDCSCAEVAQRLGVPVGTVTKRLSRAYAELRQRLTG